MTIAHDPIPGNALWIYAHPRRNSLNSHLFQTGLTVLRGDYDVAISDLYAQGFDPVLSDRDLGELSDSSGGMASLLGHAYAADQLPPDIQLEQAKLAAAELLIIQFPLWWYGPPAILKGWFDRVLTSGFAFGDLDPHTGIPRRYGDGGLAGRKALIIVTAGDDERTLGERGVSGDLDSLLFPLTHGALWYTGIESLALHVVHDADMFDTARIEREAQRLTERLHGVATEPVRRFRKLADGEYQGTRALRADILSDRSDLAIHLADPH